MSKGITDLAIRLKNSYLSGAETTNITFSTINGNILEVLKNEKYIESYELVTEGFKKYFTVVLKYYGYKPAMMDVKLVTRPGRRIYSGAKELKSVMGGVGIALLSTPKGILTNRQAKKENVGGEVLFMIW